MAEHLRDDFDGHAEGDAARGEGVARKVCMQVAAEAEFLGACAEVLVEGGVVHHVEHRVGSVGRLARWLRWVATRIARMLAGVMIGEIACGKMGVGVADKFQRLVRNRDVDLCVGFLREYANFAILHIARREVP